MKRNLRDVKKELEQALRETERLEKEARTLKIQDKLGLITQALANNETVSVFLEENPKEDARIIAETIAENFETTLEQAEERLMDARLKREERKQRRLERQKEQESSSFEEEDDLDDDLNDENRNLF